MIAKDYRLGKASYCGDCTHAASQHTRGSGVTERSNYCKGRPNYDDDCDCTRTKEVVVNGAAAGKALDRKEVEEKRGTHKHGRR